MNYLQKWMLTLSLGFLGGMVQCASDSKPQTVDDYVRHGLIGLGPAIAGLQLTLSSNQPKPEQPK